MRLMRLTHALLYSLILLPLLGAPAYAMTEKPVVQLRALDKVSARVLTFEAPVGSTVRFGSLYIKAQSCQKSSSLETPESSAFLQVWEATGAPDDADQESEWVFSGWMFASSPALSAMDHPIYDVWVMSCLNKAKAAITVESGSVEEGEGVTDDVTMPALPDADTEVDAAAEGDIDVTSPPVATPSVDP